MKAALLIIDMQYGNFLEPYPVHEGENLLRKVKNLIKKACTVDIPIIFIQNRGGAGDPVEYGTPGWSVHPSIKPMPEDIFIEKETPDSFKGTKLHKKLELEKVKRLVVTGLQTEYCVDTTCRQAYCLGYDVILVKDAHSTWSSDLLSASQIKEHHNRVLGGWYVTLRKEKDVSF
jgi:nicotinamidase-related amidase